MFFSMMPMARLSMSIVSAKSASGNGEIRSLLFADLRRGSQILAVHGDLLRGVVDLGLLNADRRSLLLDGCFQTLNITFAGLDLVLLRDSLVLAPLGKLLVRLLLCFALLQHLLLERAHQLEPLRDRALSRSSHCKKRQKNLHC